MKLTGLLVATCLLSGPGHVRAGCKKGDRVTLMDESQTRYVKDGSIDLALNKSFSNSSFRSPKTQTTSIQSDLRSKLPCYGFAQSELLFRMRPFVTLLGRLRSDRIGPHKMD